MSLDHGRISAYDQKSSDPFADVIRIFLHDQGHCRGDQNLRPATHPANSACSGSSGHQVNTMKISDEHKAADRRFVELVADSDEPPRDYFRHGHLLTAIRHILDFLNRAVRDQVNCPHDILRPNSTEGGRILGTLEYARCGLIQEVRP